MKFIEWLKVRKGITEVATTTSSVATFARPIFDDVIRRKKLKDVYKDDKKSA